MAPVVVVVDTSGSITPAALDAFAAEITSVTEDCEPERVHVVYCDDDVRGAEVFEPSDSIELHPAGHGGTDFRPPFAWVAEQEIEPACLIYLTDLCGPFPSEEPEGYPVLWIATTDDTAPFGETVRIRV